MTEEVTKLGIKETKDVVLFMTALGMDIMESFDDDGKLTGGDLVNFSDTFLATLPAFTGIDQVIPEVKDLDAAEILELKDLIVGRLPGIGDKWIDVAENAIMAGYHIFKVVSAMRGN